MSKLHLFVLKTPQMKEFHALLSFSKHCLIPLCKLSTINLGSTVGWGAGWAPRVAVECPFFDKTQSLCYTFASDRPAN
jgi:hypothetical protein